MDPTNQSKSIFYDQYNEKSSMINIKLIIRCKNRKKKPN